MKEKENKLPYDRPDLTVIKVKMETEFLTATSMMSGRNRMQSTIEGFDDTTPAPDFNGTDDGDINLIL
jgi:hypothetical protein